VKKRNETTEILSHTEHNRALNGNEIPGLTAAHDDDPIEILTGRASINNSTARFICWAGCKGG